MAFIKQLTREAQSKTNPSSLYFFYETVEGYHFITIDELFSKSVPNTHKFIHDELSTSQYSPGASGRLSTNILNLQIDETPSIGSLQDQGVSSQTYSLDTLTRKRTMSRLRELRVTILTFPLQQVNSFLVILRVSYRTRAALLSII